MDAHEGATAKAVVREKETGELPCARGIFTVGRERVGRRGRHQERRSCRGCAETSKPSSARASQIEDAKVQARRGLDEDRLLVSCVHRHLVEGGSEDPPLRAGAVRSSLITLPPFITNFTRCSSEISDNGLPETATRSANLPLAIDPI